MSVPEVFVVPGARAVLARAVPSLVEAKLVPLLLFLGCYRIWGVPAALVTALAWSVAMLGRRLVLGRRVSGLVVLGIVGLTGKTVVALLSGSLALYFLQPTLTTVLVGGAFLVSVATGRPLAERLVHDLWPIDEAWVGHAELRRFFRRLSVFWAATSLANAAITVWLLLTQSLPTFVLVKSVLGPLSAIGAILPAGILLHRALRRHGVRIEFARTAHRVPRGADEVLVPVAL